MKTFASAALLFFAVSATASAQVNAGRLEPEASLPFTMTQVADFNLPWRIAFLPDGRMLITEKVGALWLVTQQGGEDAGRERARRPATQGQGGMLGVYLSPNYATDHSVYLTYSEPGDSTDRARASRWPAPGSRSATDTASLEGLQVIWRDGARGRGGQFGAAIAFSPDRRYLFLTVGERQRMTPGAGSQLSRWARSCG